MNSLKRLLALITTALLVLLGPFLFGLHFSTLRATSWNILNTATRSQTLHLLVPATGANLNFCRLLLSAAITGYPEPILIGWEGKGIYNGTKSHLFKITETLTYLRSLPPDADDDMVLLVDGYDIWLQLRPEVLISRYAKVLATNNARVRKDGILGKWTVGGTQVRNTIIFGPDKIHWPQGSLEPAVWAAPESTLPRDAFGPKTDTDMFTIRPRYLNSGTIMGPAKDLREMFAATLDMLSAKYDASWEFHYSDQYFFAEVWGEQEVHRRKLQFGEDEFDAKPKAINKDIHIPDLPVHKRTEYHICLDYESELFQAATAWERSLAWMRFNDSTPLPKEGKEVWSEKDMKSWKLRGDILASNPPFSALEDSGVEGRGWEEVMLGTNTVSQNPFPLFHVTGNKQVRDWWWPRMWFHPHGEKLLLSTKGKVIPASEERRQSFATVDGVQWIAAKPVQSRPRIDELGKGGAWEATSGGWVGWGDMCVKHEPVLFLEEMPADEGAD